MTDAELGRALRRLVDAPKGQVRDVRLLRDADGEVTIIVDHDPEATTYPDLDAAMAAAAGV